MFGRFCDNILYSIGACGLCQDVIPNVSCSNVANSVDNINKTVTSHPVFRTHTPGTGNKRLTSFPACRRRNGGFPTCIIMNLVSSEREGLSFYFDICIDLFYALYLLDSLIIM